MRTYTDLATMEGANEAARRAVNCILDAEGISSNYCKIWKLHEPWLLAPLRWHDARRFKKGLPWKSHLPWYIRLFISILKLILKILKYVLSIFKK